MKRVIPEKLGGFIKKYRYPVWVLLAGVILLMLPTGNNTKTGEVITVQDAQTGFSLAEFTAQTEKLLSCISGAGKVRLLLTLERDGNVTYLSDRQESVEGESLRTQTQTVLGREGSNDTPIPVTRDYPEFRGAVVICQGARDPKVILGIKEAISSLTGLGMDKITVLKMD